MFDIQTLVFSCAGAESTGRAVPLGERPGQPLAQEQELSRAVLEAEELLLKGGDLAHAGTSELPRCAQP